MENNNINPAGPASGETFEVDLDALEAAAGPGSEGEGGVKPNEKEDAKEFFDIDERFKDLPPAEARFRTIQSRYDTVVKERNDALASSQELEAYRNFVNQVLADEKMAIALVNQVNPELIPKKDMSQVIKSKLKEKFGEGYKPQLSRQEAERDDPGGKDWQYYRMLDEITKSATEDDPQHSMTIKQYKEKLNAMKEEEKQAALKEIDDVKKKFNTTDDEIRAVSEFLNKMSLEQGVRLHRLLRKISPKIPGVTNVSGHSSGPPSDRQRMIKEIFG